MRSLRLQIVPLMIAGGLLLTACDQVRLPGASGQQEAEPKLVEEPATPGTEETGPAEVELPVRPETASNEAAIDWEAARRDLAARPIEDREGSFQVASGDAAPPGPVFLPSAPVSVQGGSLMSASSR